MNKTLEKVRVDIRSTIQIQVYVGVSESTLDQIRTILNVQNVRVILHQALHEAFDQKI